uniref:Uncharacterized protein n=1 Tax=Anguilla anguilla TaxID=7936 RepID=A0A0E9TPU8_ANGAN
MFIFNTMRSDLCPAEEKGVTAGL